MGNSNTSLSKGEIRLAQAYLRVLGCYGDPNQIRGADVVNGNWNQATAEAAQRFVKFFGKSAHMHDPSPQPALLHALRNTNQLLLSNTSEDNPASGTLSALAHRFNTREHPPQKSIIARLHPLLRFPLTSALDTLARKGVSVTVTNETRDLRTQEQLVMDGHSTAPPGWSFHEYGLAVDVYPATRDPKRPVRTDDPRWREIIDTMKAHGFYSLYDAQGWDMPHFELPLKTKVLVELPADTHGWKLIPDALIPKSWKSINQRVLKH